MTTIKQGENFLFRAELNDVQNVDDPLTSGLLVVGLIYKIVTYVSGDDFSNVGALSEADGVEFTATGTTPAVWTNGSTLQQIQRIPILASEIADFELTALDSADAVLKVWNRNSPFMRITDGLAVVEVSRTDTKKWLGDIVFQTSPSFVEPEYFASGEQTDVACFDDLLTVESC